MAAVNTAGVPCLRLPRLLSGQRQHDPTTVDEVLEVLFKVISGLILASCLLKAGFGKPVGSPGRYSASPSARSFPCCI